MATDLDYDFFGIQLQARILVTGGSAMPFDPLDPQTPSRLVVDPNVPEFIQFVYQTLEQITVDEQMGTFSTIEVTFTPTYDVALKMLESPYIKVGNVLFVRWGYSKADSQLVTPWKSGLIISPPRVQLGPMSRLTIVANGWGHQMARYIKKNRVLTGKFRKIFRDILINDWEFKPEQVIDSQASAEYTNNNAIPFNGAVQSDYDILRRLAHDSGNDLIINGSNVKVVSKKVKFNSKAEPRVTFTLFGQMDPPHGDFPMYDFEFQADALFLPPFQKGVESVTVNKDASKNANTQTTKEQADFKAGTHADDPSKLKTERVSGGQGPKGSNPNVRQTETAPDVLQGRHLTPGANDSNIQSLLSEAGALATLQGAFIKVTWNAMGVPFIEPEDLVRLRGVGVFEGVYYLTAVSHAIGRGGYDMSCEAINRTSLDALKLVTPTDQNAGTSISINSQPEQPTGVPAGAGAGSPGAGGIFAGTGGIP